MISPLLIGYQWDIYLVALFLGAKHWCKNCSQFGVKAIVTESIWGPAWYHSNSYFIKDYFVCKSSGAKWCLPFHLPIHSRKEIRYEYMKLSYPIEFSFEFHYKIRNGKTNGQTNTKQQLRVTLQNINHYGLVVGTSKFLKTLNIDVWHWLLTSDQGGWYDELICHLSGFWTALQYNHSPCPKLGVRKQQQDRLA